MSADRKGKPALTVACLMQALHVGLRYKALSVLQLPNVNQKRGAALVLAHVAGLPIPGMQCTLMDPASDFEIFPGMVTYPLQQREQ